MKGMSTIVFLVVVFLSVMVLAVGIKIVTQPLETGGTLVEKILECMGNLGKCSSGQQQKTSEVIE
ncbi:MAG TPA: hypothetical protein VI933_03835 [archaeon]|nr:hypothetical protein [archaeon]